MDLLYSFYLQPLIKSPTRITPTSATLLDNIFTNVHTCVNSGILISDVSDHMPVFSFFSAIIHSKSELSSIYVKRNITESNLRSFYNRLKNVTWENCAVNGCVLTPVIIIFCKHLKIFMKNVFH